MEFIVDAELKRMWNLCPQCIKDARELPSGEMDDPYTKIALIGFSYNQHKEKWNDNHIHAVKEYMKECDGMGHDAKMKNYLALCHGALMGLYSAKAIGKELFMYGMSTLPGIAYSKGSSRP